MLLETLDVFQEIAFCGSISQAASKLHMSPSNLSKRLSDLEAELGVQLFFRTPIFRLTPAGVTFLNEAPKITHTYHQTLKDCRQIAKEKLETIVVQEYSIADASSASRFKIMSDVKKQNARINIEMCILKKTTPRDALKRRIVDIAQTSFVISYEQFAEKARREGISVYPLSQEKLYIAFEKQCEQLAKKEYLTLDDIEDLAIRIPYGDYYSPYRSCWEDLCSANKTHPLFKFIKQRSGSLSSFFMHGMNPDEAYFLPESMLDNVWITKRSDELCFKELRGKRSTFTTCMMILDSNEKQGVRMFRTALDKHSLSIIKGKNETSKSEG